MIDISNGWAITSDQKHVLFTTNGGTQWHDVTPRTGWPQYTFGSTEFLDTTHAWVTTVQVNTNKFSIFRTCDGGQTWLETSLTAQVVVNVSQFVFVDQQDGWLLLSPGAAMNQEAVEILHTTDGGNTWLKASVANEQTGNQKGAIPLVGEKTGISFLNATTGWITGTTFDPVTNTIHAWLYVTHDSGSTWQPQNLPLPTNSNVGIWPPTFFSSSAGVMPVSNGDKLSIYTTHDGGNSWQGSTPASVPEYVVTFIDPNHGWATGDAVGTTAIYSTSDGGQHWTKLTSSVSSKIEDITRLNFVSNTTGWALGSTVSSAMLYQTTDGGKTWKHFTPTVS